MLSAKPFAQRVWTFLNERFPVWPAQVLVAAQVAFALKYISPNDSVPLYAILVRAAIVPAFLLLMRISDELKDLEDDKVHFPERPLAIGHVTQSDLSALAWISLLWVFVIALFDGANEWMWLFLFVSLLLHWIDACLVFPGTADSWLAAFGRHHSQSCQHPDWTLSGFHIGGPVALDGQCVALLGSQQLVLARLEIGRKIRRPADETSYVTYSKLWGPRVAAGITLFLMFAGLALIVAAGPEIPASLFIVPVAVLGVAAFGGLRFLFDCTKFRFPSWTMEAGILSSFMYMVSAVLVR